MAATNATGVTVTGSDGSSYTLQANGGVQAVSPDRDHHLHGHRDRSGRQGHGQRDRDGDAGAPSAPTVSITANPTTITAGSASTLMVAAINATGVTVTGTDGSSYTCRRRAGPRPSARP